MHLGLKGLVRESLKKFNIGIVKYSRLQLLEEKYKSGGILEMLLECPESSDGQLGPQDARLLRALRRSKSQLGQDLFSLVRTRIQDGWIFCRIWRNQRIGFEQYAPS
jgi:hypothetical protein